MELLRDRERVTVRELESLALGSPPGRIVLTGFFCPPAPWPSDDRLLVATEISGTAQAVRCPAAGTVAGLLRRRGLNVELGPVTIGREGPALATEPLAVVLAPLTGPWGHHALKRARSALLDLAGAVRAHTVLMAAPRASCAGVHRAVETVELALERFGPPIYVRRQIVHNAHVVEELERRGATFVEEVDEVPVGSTIVFSAHGVSPDVRAAARARRLNVIDATCPLVSKVHAEARRFAQSGYTIVLVGHAEHEEVVGTRGEAPERTVVVEGPADVARLRVDDPGRVAHLTQTTLAVDDTAETVAALRARFPALAGPRTSDICYATQNRQDAVRTLAAECDLILVVGSRNSSNSQRLVEVAERSGTCAHLIEDESTIVPVWLAHARMIGLTAGASAPESVVQRVLAAIRAFGPVHVEERRVASETVHFRSPPVGRAVDHDSGTDASVDAV